ncbi:MAG: hypothetical protein ABWX84_15320 [Nocardioides sp.]
MTAPIVYVHIGAPKTGTTYLQDRLGRNARRLAEHDVHVPRLNPVTTPAISHFRGALDLLGEDWGGRPGHADGAWPRLARKVRRSSGRVIISHEILAPAPPARISRLMNDLEGCEVHVVYSVRDLARQLPAAWQESVKQGRTWRFKRFLNMAESGKPWFMRAFDVPTVLGNWSRTLPPERVHVVTVPPSSAAPDELWLRFCQAFGIDPAWAPLDSERSNASLGIAETELLRLLNRRIHRRTRGEQPHDDMIRHMLDSGQLGGRKSRKVELPPTRLPWAEQQAERWIEWVKGAGVMVHGDLEDLRPRVSVDERWRDPDKASNKALVRAGVDALAVMTREAASRPDPRKELGARARRWTEQLRER